MRRVHGEQTDYVRLLPFVHRRRRLRSRRTIRAPQIANGTRAAALITNAAELTSFVNATAEIAIHKIRNDPRTAQMLARDGTLWLV